MESEGEISSFRKFKMALNPLHGKRGGLMVSVLVFRSSSLDSKPGWGYCVVFLTWAYSCSASLHPGVYMGISDLNAGGIILQWTAIPSRGSGNTPGCFTLQKL